MGAVKVTFPPATTSAFVAEVKREVDRHFRERGVSDKADAAMVTKTVILLGGYVATYVALVFGGFAPLAMLGLAVLLGVLVAGIGFSVAHDALHGAYSSRPWVNRVLGYSFDLMGANGYIWKITHNVVHHTYTNIHGIDEDLTVSPLVRLSPGSPRWPIHRYQHWFAFVAYGFATVFWVFAKDFIYFAKRELGPYRDRRHPATEWVTLVVTKAFYYGYTIVVPWLVLDVAWWQFAIGFLAMHLTAGVILGVVFQLAHVVEETEYPLPDHAGEMEHAWLVHQMVTTANFARDNRPLSWYVGGLNHQIEHHLFPRVCSTHYPAIAPIVQRVAEKHGIPYNQHPTFAAAVRSHFRMLKLLGAGEEPVMAAAAA